MLVLFIAPHGTALVLAIHVEIQTVVITWKKIHQMTILMMMTMKMVKNKLALVAEVEFEKYRQRCVDISASEFSRTNT